jgi:HEAT repeat protein
MSETTFGIFTTDRDLVIRSWDGWLSRASGIAAGAAIGKPLSDVIPGIEERRLVDFFSRSLNDGVIEVLAPRFHHFLISCPPAAPSRRFDRMQQKVTIAPLKEDSGTVGLVVTVEDVTARLDREHDASLADAFDHDNWALRRTAVAQMSSQGSVEAVSSLLKTLREQHRNLSVLNSALRVLTSSGLDTLSPLLELLKDADPELRMYAALGLGDLKNRGAIPALIETLRDPDINVRYHVIEALTKIRAPEAADELLRIAESGDFFLAFPAIDALAQLADPLIATRLVPLLENEMVRTAVVDALGQLGDESVVAPLATLLGRRGLHLASVAQALITLHDRYQQQFQEGEHIADLVRRHAPPEAAGALIDILDESDAPRLRGVVRLLSWINDERVAGTLTRLLGSGEVRKEVIEALVRHGKGVTEALIGQLTADDPEVRRSAVTCWPAIPDLALWRPPPWRASGTPARTRR